jgi:hypothetical protein
MEGRTARASDASEASAAVGSEELDEEVDEEVVIIGGLSG